jgi:hypothetical protein
MHRDRLYQEVLKSFDHLQAVWKQQPGNTPALERSSDRLRSALVALRQSAARTPPADTAEKGQAKQSSTGPATRPVPPGTRPSSPEQVRKGREATLEGTYLPGPRLKKEPSKSLANVPAASIEKQCRVAEAKLDTLTLLLRASEVDQKAVATTLTELRALLNQLGTPASAAPASQPNPAKQAGGT